LRCLLLIGACLGAPSSVVAQQILGYGAKDQLTYGMELMIDSRFFFQPPPFEDQRDIMIDPSIAAEPYVTYVLADPIFGTGRDSFAATLFGRYDPTDSGRTHGDVREAFYLHEDDGWDVLFGVNQVFWGVTEARHLVNIVNQVDYMETQRRDVFLGQPMLNVTAFGNWGTLDLFAMPYFRERQFHEQSARFGSPISIDSGEFESDLGKWHPDFALRYSNSYKNWDFAVSHFYGTSRDPCYRLRYDEEDQKLPIGEITFDRCRGAVNPEAVDDIADFLGIDVGETLSDLDEFFSLVPTYRIINQTGLEMVGVYDDLILKFEGATISGYQGDRIWALVGGFEYTFPNVDESGIDVGFLGEYLFDNRNYENAPFTPFNNDIYGGARVSLNNADSTNLLLGAVVDVDYGSTILSLQAEHRIAENMLLSVDAQGFVFISDSDPLVFYKNSSYVQLRLSIFF